MKKLLIFALFLIFISCNDDNVPFLPSDLDSTQTVDTSIFDSNEATQDFEDKTDFVEIFQDESEQDEINDDDVLNNPCNPNPCKLLNRNVCKPLKNGFKCECNDGFFDRNNQDCIKTSLLVAQVEGYDVPKSGHLFIAKNEDIQKFQEITFSHKLGSNQGADLNINTFFDRIMLIERHNSSRVDFYVEKGKVEKSDFSNPKDFYVNFHTAVFDKKNQRYIISANQYDGLFIKPLDKKYFELSLKSLKQNNVSTSPYALKIIDDKLFVTLQNLDSSWNSNGGNLLVFNLNSLNLLKNIKLNFPNPTGNIEYNKVFDKNHIYIVCSGSWQKRDGGLIRISLKDFKQETVLEESKKEGEILDGDFFAVSISDSGKIFLMISDNRTEWTSKLLLFDTKTLKISEVDTNINGFGATPIDYSPVSNKIYYFKDKQADTFLVARDVKTNKVELKKLKYGPSALKIWVKH